MLFTLLAQVETVTKALDHAAEQDMRWWFLGLLFVMGAAIAYLARYWSARHDRLSARLDTVQDERTKDFKDTQAMHLQILSDNSVAFRAFSEMLGSVKHLFEPATRSNPGH